MLYCKVGDLLIVKPDIDSKMTKFFRLINKTPYAVALEEKTHKHKHIREGEVVVALQNSVPPFYWSDTVKCLWGNCILHIRRIELQHYPSSNISDKLDKESKKC